MSYPGMPTPMDAASAQMALQDPATPAVTLAQIAQTHPQLRIGVVAHPHVYTELLDWMVQQGDPAVAQAVAQRRAATGGSPTAPAGAPMAPGAPYAQPPPQGVAPAQPYPPGAGQGPTAVPPKRRLSGLTIGLIAAVGLIILGLLAWFVVVPAIRGGAGGPTDPYVKRTPVILKAPSGWSQLDLGSAFGGAGMWQVDTGVGDVIAVWASNVLAGVDLKTNKTLWTTKMEISRLTNDETGNVIVIDNSNGGNTGAT